jgi:hypothetical protein
LLCPGAPVLEAALSCLERELLPLAHDPPTAAAAAAAAGGEQLPISYQAGYAPQHATPREWVASFQVLQVGGLAGRGWGQGRGAGAGRAAPGQLPEAACVALLQQQAQVCLPVCL